MKLNQLVFAVAALLSTAAHSGPLVEFREGNVLITLYDEPCVLTEVVNLPNRAEWIEKGIKTEGCWSINLPTQTVVVYFADKTVAVIPARVFTKATAI